MPFSENQLFYTALLWTSALPGGDKYAPQICERYNREKINFPSLNIKRKPLSWDEYCFKELEKGQERATLSKEEFNRKATEDMKNPVPPEQLDTFFDNLFTALKEKKEFQRPDTNCRNTFYIQLSKMTGASSDHPAFPETPFSDELENAMLAANIKRGQMPQNIWMYVHDDGHIFVSQKWTRFSLDYPGKPELPYKHMAIKPEDMDSCPRLTWETLYRLVPLQPGQKYKSGWISILGERCEHEKTAREGEVITVSNSDVEDVALLESLSDEDILNFDPVIKLSLAEEERQYKDGYKNPHGKSYIEKTDKPNIVRHMLPDVAYMEVKEPVQIGYGWHFSVAKSGDFIIRDGEHSNPRVMRKETIESGKVRFVFPQGLQAPRPKLN